MRGSDGCVGSGWKRRIAVDLVGKVARTVGERMVMQMGVV